jgi:HD-like signal output (HDOD) protein
MVGAVDSPSAMLVPTATPPTELATYLRRQVAAGKVEVPPYPAVAARLQELAADPRAGVRELAEVVGRDVALAAAVIRAASSATVARGAGVVTLEQAVWKIGAAELARLALAMSLGAGAVRSGPLALLRRERWRHALLSAVFAQELAARRGLHRDQAFLAGLIHDLGAVIAIGLLETRCAGRPPSAIDPTWSAVVDEVHLELGLVLAERWKVAPPLRDAIAAHHEPVLAAAAHRPLVELVAIVDRVIAALSSPAGIAGLDQVAGLSADERAHIATVMPRVGEVMATFAATLPSDGGLAPAPVRPTGWPVHFALTAGANRAAGRAVLMTAGTLEFDCAAPLSINWLTDIVLEIDGTSVPMLANVMSCERTGGAHRVTIAPFGLDGPIKSMWFRLLEQARADYAA